MDQIAALHWLKENIAEFGGDPENVTIFGHGTGAACINFLMTSKAVPKNPRLFHRAVLMSGSSLAPWSLVHDPMKYTRQLTHSINCSHTPLGDELKKCLRTKNLHLIMKAQVEVSEVSEMLLLCVGVGVFLSVGGGCSGDVMNTFHSDTWGGW
ncbi:Neuroligin-2-like, partial [Homarus americanus]